MAERTDKEHRQTIDDNDQLWVRLVMAGRFKPGRESPLGALESVELWDMVLGR